MFKRQLTALLGWLGAAICTPTIHAGELAVRDALTGAPIEAVLEIPGNSGHRDFALSGAMRTIPEATEGLIWAPGYHSQAVRLSSATSRTTVLLDPLLEPAPFARATQRWRQHPDSVWLQGYVRRVDDGIPIAGAVLSIGGQQTRSTADGYFELDVSALRAKAGGRAVLEVNASGYRPHRREGLVVVAGVQRLLIALGPGITERSVQTIGALDRGDRAVDEDALSMAALPRTVTPAGLLLAPTMLPPATIRVGFADAACTQSCCTNACSNTCTLSLETYVKRGLDSEWIASWNAQSLRAGSVAYRSYGAWRVANPIRSNFDICSSACCQVNDAGTSSSTDAAVARTPGILLTRNGSDAASAEYSAENNSWDDPNDGLSCSNVDLSCGNGFAGSPSAGWPCLSDAVSINKGCFGHGRGMSQWGTQRWALQPKAWPWMVDHYFNDNGTGSGLRTAVMSSPLLLADLAAQPAVLAPGSSFQILANASNSAGATHSRLLIGASLYRAGVGYLDDSAHDAALALAPGTTAITRTFDVPPSSIDGSYDLLLSLYLDVDENGSISAADLALALARINGAVTIQTPPVFDGFSDGFEDVPRPVP